jgi:hypothetical protein
LLLCAVTKEFDLSRMGGTAQGTTWISLLEGVLEARTTMNPDTVSVDLWNAFLIYAWVLVPSIQGW